MSDRKEYWKIYGQSEERRRYQKEWREKNKDKLKIYEESEQRKKDRKDSRDRRKDKRKEYDKSKWPEKKIKDKDRVKEYRSKNQSKINEYNRNYMPKYKNHRKENDPIFKASMIVRDLISKSIRGKGFTKKSKTCQILGCSFEEFKSYLESKFEPWMTWENHGKYNGELNCGWDIDHIIPVSSAKNEEDVIKLNNFTNLQPLCSYVNRYIKINK